MPESAVLASMDAEQSVLGSVFFDESTIKMLRDKLIVEDFYYLRHQLIFKAMEDLNDKGEPIDSTTVIAYLDDHGQLNDCGGGEYILEVTESVPSISNLDTYIDIVKDKSAQRKVVQACNDIIKNANDSILDIKEFLDDAEKKIYDATSERTTKDMVSLSKMLEDARAKIQENSQKSGYITGLSTGFRKLDRATLGLQPAELTILAARPSVGKTSLALNIATNVAKLPEHPYVAFFSLEMSLDQMALRMLASESMIGQTELKTGKFYNERNAWEKINYTINSLKDINLMFDESGATTIQDVRSICRKKKSEGKLDLVIVDYLQLLSTAQHYESRVQQIGEISRILKEMSRELKIPVIALSQLNREAENQSDGPSMAMLREAGNLEQDADVVILLYRPKDETGQYIMDQVKVKIAKNRNGMLDEFPLLFTGKNTKFSDVLETEESE